MPDCCIVFDICISNILTKHLNMSVSTFELSNFSSQITRGYFENIDGNADVMKRLAAIFAPHEQEIPNMTIRLDAGVIYGGTELMEIAPQDTPTITVPQSDERIDRVVINRLNGVVSVISGVEDLSPAPPALAWDMLPIAQVKLSNHYFNHKR